MVLKKYGLFSSKTKYTSAVIRFVCKKIFEKTCVFELKNILENIVVQANKI
jgi:hypothetical protein